MKKALVLALLIVSLFGFGTLSAQQSEYYRTGDTIEGRCPIYFYPWWTDTWLSDPSHRLTWYATFQIAVTTIENEDIPINQLPHGELLQYYYTDTPIEIIGIATTMYNQTYIIPDLGIGFQEYLRLYDATEGDLVLLKEVPLDMGAKTRTMNVTWRANHRLEIDNDCCYDSTADKPLYIRVREFYFDKPVTVYDSFYIGYTTENQITTHPPNYEVPFDGLYARLSDYSIYWDSSESKAHYAGQHCTTYCDETPYTLRRYKNINWYMNPQSPHYGDTIPDTGWHWVSRNKLMLEFPILVIDSSYIIVDTFQCLPVENLRVGHYGEHNAVLLWDVQDQQQSYQVSYGPAGTPPDSGTFINAPINAYNILGLDSGVHYSAYVRAVCLHDSVWYSSWSDPVDIFIADTSSHGADIGHGSDNPLAPDDGITLVPNPATDEVTVFSDSPILQVELFDLQGKTVYNSAALAPQPSLFRIALNDYPKGAYTVRIHTTHGTANKRLVVK